MVKITKDFIEEMNLKGFCDDRPRPYFEWDINCGLCEDWANKVYKELKNVNIEGEVVGNDQMPKYDDLPWHVFIKIGKKYFDCECLDGVTKVTDLPIFSRNENLEREEARKFYNR